jgi:hypothetical protein
MEVLSDAARQNSQSPLVIAGDFNLDASKDSAGDPNEAVNISLERRFELILRHFLNVHAVAGVIDENIRMAEGGNSSLPCCAIDVISVGLVTSSVNVRMRSGYRRAKRHNFETSRAVAISRSPRFSASSARRHPKPVEVPVINQTRENVNSSFILLLPCSWKERATLSFANTALQGGIHPTLLESMSFHRRLSLHFDTSLLARIADRRGALDQNRLNTFGAGDLVA